MSGRRVRVWICLFGGAFAIACDLPAGETATVASVADGETLVLADGRTVRLLGVKAPSPPLGATDDHPWPFVAESKAGTRAPDVRRHGRA